MYYSAKLKDMEIKMRTGLRKLTVDLEIMEAMAALMPAYIASDGLFWNIGVGGMPTLTLGGYFMRQHRLLALADLLSDSERVRLQTAVSTISEAIAPQTVQFERKVQQELLARLRQWGEYLKDLQREHGDAVAGYKTAVEVRVMVTVLTELLVDIPHRIDNGIINQINKDDQTLRHQWLIGEFVWATEWMRAYPSETYWWLYGRPA